MSAPSTTHAAATGTALRPFRVDVPQPALDDLRRRLVATRWPREEPIAGWGRGVPLRYMKRLVEYWADHYDWRRHEGELNEMPQFVATIGDQDVHFLHVRSPEPEARPLILTHGWPSSPIEFLRVIRPLSDPRSVGGDAADAFHLVIPSLPGYGFSPPPQRPGWGNLFSVAAAWAKLMSRLGYERYAVQGTDVGAGVAEMLAVIDGPRIIGVHVTGTIAAMPLGPPLDLDGLRGATANERRASTPIAQMASDTCTFRATRPQTLANSLNDSPVGQLAWIVEKFQEWTDPAVDLPDYAVDRDQLLTNASIYWFAGAGAGSAHATYDGIQAWREMTAREHGPGQRTAATGPPRGFAVFAADTAIKSMIDPAGQIEHWSQFDRGGHFPAMETPELLTADIRSFFRALR